MNQHESRAAARPDVPEAALEIAPDVAPDVAVIGGGPAGLMAAEAASAQGARVVVFDAMASVGRKFLLAGKGGLNLTHAEALPAFETRYGGARARLAPLLEVFGPAELRAFAGSLGLETFVGSSGRVFPRDMKAAPLLRRWLHRLRERGVLFRMRYRWCGWTEAGGLRFATPDGEVEIRAGATVLALGGGSWPRLGSDGAWTALLAARGVEVLPLRPANCGFDLRWSAHFIERYAGAPVKPVAASCDAADGSTLTRRGEFVVTASGIEGSLVYALSAPLRDALEAHGRARLTLDLLPDVALPRVQRALAAPRGKRTLSEHLKRGLGLVGVKAALLREVLGREEMADPARLAQCIKALPLDLLAPRPLAEAISSAGGVALDRLDPQLMLHDLPGVFCAGEMLDWEAPTGGYLLTAAMSTGHHAGRAAAQWATAHHGAEPGLLAP